MKVLLLVCCCLMSAISQGQISIVNLTDHDSTSKTLVIGRPYLLRIANVPASALLEMSDDYCSYVGDHVYNVLASACTRSPISKAVLFIYNSHHDLLFSQNFILKYLPDTTAIKATLAGSCGYDVTVAELCANPYLRLSSARYMVISFSFSIMKLRSDPAGPFNFKGAKVSGTDVRKCWFDSFDLKPGNRIFIDDIKAQCTGCRDTINLNPIVIRIKK